MDAVHVSAARLSVARDGAVAHVETLVDVDGCILNRHAILHGEATDYGTEEVSLKTVSLLGYICWVFGDGGVLGPMTKRHGARTAIPRTHHLPRASELVHVAVRAASDVMTLSLYEQAAARWRPDRVRLLVLAESPPASIDRYFYFENVSRQDSLWAELMKALYPGSFGEVRRERPNKSKWLARFRDDGCFLIDAEKRPFSKGQSDASRERSMRQNTARIIEEMQQIGAEGLVVVKATVWRALGPAIRSAGLPLLNRGAVAFPGSGQQRKFHDEVEAIGMRQFVRHGAGSRR